MKGMIFAAGLGTRLRPLTDTVPKCLIEVGGKPMLERVIESFQRAGITDITVNVHHHAEQVKQWLSEHPSGARITVSDESEQLLDTGGGLLKAAPMLEDSDGIVIHNADVLTDIDLRRMMEAHTASGADAMLLTRSKVSARALMWDTDGRLRGWANLQTGQTRPEGLDLSGLTAMGFGGVHIIKPALLRALREYASGVFSITPFYADMCDRLIIRSYPLADKQWIDIGKPESLAKARELYSATT
nr:nucleotidyltransferase family protein [Bacteroides sp.]